MLRYRFSPVCRSSLYRLHCLGTSGACDMAIHKSENPSIRVVIMLLIARLARCRFSREEREAAEQGMHQYASPEYALFFSGYKRSRTLLIWKYYAGHIRFFKMMRCRQKHTPICHTFGPAFNTKPIPNPQERQGTHRKRTEKGDHFSQVLFGIQEV